MQLNQFEKELKATDWWPLVKTQFQMPYYAQLRDFLYSPQAYDVKTDKTGKITHTDVTCFPRYRAIFNALKATSFKDTKVVILGQDPYPTPGNAMGLSFSVQPGMPIPASLKDIYIELNHDLAYQIPDHGCLLPWTAQGVLLLNTVLTVHCKAPHSHQHKGWETFTNHLIKALSDKQQPVIFILWGRDAQNKEPLIDSHHNIIIASPHPSPLSAYRGFFGSRPFSKANTALKALGMKPVDWSLPKHMTMKDCVKYFK